MLTLSSTIPGRRVAIFAALALLTPAYVFAQQTSEAPPAEQAPAKQPVLRLDP